MFLGTAINTSPTITGKAGAAITNGAFLAVRFDGSGNIILPAAGGNALGLLIATTPPAIAIGEDVTIQIKDIGLWTSGAAIAAGAELTPNAAGQAVTAATGNHILAVALAAATGAGQPIRVQIVKSGRQPA